MRNTRKYSLAISCALIATMVMSCAATPHTKGVPAATVAAEKPAGMALQPNAAPPMPPPPRQSGKSETFNVTVRDVPVADVLFVLARDAHLSLDISPRVVGQVTLIAVDQTLPQILSRIAEQVAMRYEFRDSSIVVKADTPYDRQYKIDYVNIERESKSASNISTQIQAGSNGQVTIGAGGASGSSGGGGSGDTTNNNSTAQLTSNTRNQFWRSLTQNVKALVGDNTPLTAGTNGGGPQLSAASPAAASPDASFVAFNSA